MNQQKNCDKLNDVLERIETAAVHAGRNCNDITLVGAAKQKPTSLIAEYVKLGLLNIGQNYLQEAFQAQKDLKELHVYWHFIGQIQSNKTQQIAASFDWVHSVDRLKIAQRLSDHRSAHVLKPSNLNILLQINIDNETTKAGVSVAGLDNLIPQVAALNSINLRGFMLLPNPTSQIEKQREPFAKARELLTLYNQRYGLHMDSLSMGMSNDLEAAILEGSTIVRIGSDLFGARN